MDDLADMRSVLQGDLTIDDGSSLFPPAKVNSALQRAYRKIKGLFRWSELEDAQKTSAKANHQYYDYPDGWRPNSIWRLVVDGVDYGEPMAFKDFLFEIENNNPSGVINKWSNNNKRYFIDPTPTSDGSENIEIFGHKVGDDLVEDEDTTIFTGSMPEVNEAIVLEANAILHAQGDEAQLAGQFYSPQAASIVANAWNRVKQEKAKEQRTTSFFNVPDFFGRFTVQSIKKRIGNF